MWKKLKNVFFSLIAQWECVIFDCSSKQDVLSLYPVLAQGKSREPEIIWYANQKESKIQWNDTKSIFMA